ncbi:hypothetical protein [Lysinibacter sp. HNR]|uniref:hypothetical protein n=1 Tax=Lysinibacter sp. HNR TaxID=3031408 RepID=UPI002434A24D|nr:hypothetical protein [Lysinibacter sp. HNR]WGD37283.1 hypothetical protein FrondiHNR_12780 [Lysinibacter sp. HNR]
MAEIDKDAPGYEMWMLLAEDLVKYVEESGGFPRPTVAGVGKWTSHQRKLRMEGQLEEARGAWLDEKVPGWDSDDKHRYGLVRRRR